MALGGRDVLKLVVDADSAGAVKEFDKLGREIKKTVGDSEKGATGLKQKFGNAFQGLADRSTLASGALNKLGVSGQQAGMAIASAIPAAGVAAAGALGLFAVKGIQAFQSTALAADKFADSTGLGVEEASKWIAVADDVGVSAGTFQSAFVKMEKAIDTNRSAFGDLVATAKDGSVDMSATFLNVITHLQGIEDPIKRANEASKFFGRGFAEVSEIITTDAADLRTALEGVSEAQIIDEAEVAKARNFQAVMDELGEVTGDLAIALGEQLVPVVADAAAKLIQIADAARHVGELASEADRSTGGWISRLNEFAGQHLNPFAFVDDSLNKINEEFGNTAGMDKATAAVGRFATAEAQAAAQGNHLSLAHSGMADSTAAASAQFGNFEARVAASGHAMQRQADAANAANDALHGLLNAQLAVFDSTFAVTDAQNRFTTAAFAANSAVDDGSTVLNEQTIAQDDAAQAALGAAAAAVRQASDQKILQGATLSAKEATAIQINTLTALAQKIGGPVAAHIMGMVGNLKTLDKTNADPDATLNDQATGPIGNVSSSIMGLNGKTATVRVNADTGAALANVRNLLNSMSRLSVPVRAVVRKEGGPIPGSTGTPVPILAHGGEYVLSADVVDRIKRGDASSGASASLAVPTGGSSGGATVFNFNGTFLTSEAALGRMVDEALAVSRRRGNRAA